MSLACKGGLCATCNERGRTPESVRRQFAETVQPMAALHVRPTRAFADLVIAGDNPIQQSVDTVLAHIERQKIEDRIQKIEGKK